MMKKEKVEIPDQELILLPWMGRAMKQIDLFFKDHFESAGVRLTKVQWLMLKLLDREDGQPQNQLAFLTNRDKASLTRLIDTMERKNLVARIPSKSDQRINHIYITKHGEKIYQQTIPVSERLVEIVQKDVTEEEIETVIRVMKKIINNLKESELVAVETNEEK
jgi:DNA-binding MarR family transcriptional regulator